MKPETRTFEVPVEFRAAEDGQESRTIVGLAVPYNRLARVHAFVDGEQRPIYERFLPDAFANQIADRTNNIIGDMFHNSTIHLASVKNGSLRLRDAEEGLRFEMEIVRTSAGQDALELVRSGEVRGASISFLPTGDDGERIVSDPNLDLPVREVVSAKLFAITLTPRPAYAETEVRLRDELLAQLDPKPTQPRNRERWAQYRRNLAGT